jgi:hypothetical protein
MMQVSQRRIRPLLSAVATVDRKVRETELFRYDGKVINYVHLPGIKPGFPEQVY